MVFNVHFQLDVEMCLCSIDLFAEETDLRADTVFVYLCISVFVYWERAFSICSRDVSLQQRCVCRED